MKKWLAMMLVVAIAFVFVGCTKEDEVKTVAVESVHVTAKDDKKTLKVAETVQLSTEVKPANATNKSVSYVSSDPEVATVSNSGLVTAKKVGKTTITATADGKNNTIEITVTEKDLVINTTPSEVEVGVELTLTANIGVTWSSSDVAIATVDAATGKFKGVAAGTVTITATSKVGEQVKTVSIKVTEKVVVLEIANAPLEAEKGQEVTLTANKTVVWTSSNEAVATVDAATGKVVFLAAGTVTITAKAGEETKEVTITVVFVELQVTGMPTGNVMVGKTVTLVANKEGVTWTTSNPEVATVENGVVTLLAEGEVTITATLADEEKSVNIIVIPFEEGDIVITAKDDLTQVMADFTLKLTATLDDVVLTKDEVIWESSNEEVAKVEDGVVTGISAGTVTITAYSGDLFGSYDITVITRPNPTKIEIAGNPKVELESTITLRIDSTKIEPTGAYTSVTWSIDNESVATIDANGKVTAVTLGTATVTAVSTKDETVKAEFLITVVEKEIIKIEVPDAKEVKITGEKQVYVGKTINLSASVLPEDANQNVTWKVMGTDATIDPLTGKLKGVRAGGSVWVVATSADGKATGRVSISVLAAPTPDPIPNLGGYEIVILNAESALKDDNPRLEGYKGADKAQKVRAWDTIENDYNVKFAVKAYSNDAPWGPSRIKHIIDAATTNSTKADFYVIASEWVSPLANGNAILNTREWYERYGEGQMENSVRESSTYKGGLYAISTGTAARNYVDRGIFYNMAILEKYDLPSPAKLFMEDKWTYSGFVDYVKKARAVMTSDKEFVLGGHPFYYWMYMTNAAGIRIADINTMKLNLTVPAAKAAAAAIKDVIQAGAYDTAGIAYDANVESFNAGNTLMQVGDLWFVKESTRWKSDLWGDNTKFGYVPFPYPDTMASKDQTRLVSVGGSIYVQGAGKQYPSGVDAKSVYRAFTETFLKTIEYSQEDPTYDEMSIRTNAASAKVDDPYSIQAILYFTGNKVIFDPMNNLLPPYTTGSLGPVLSSIVINGDDFETSMIANKAATENKFIEIYG